MLHVRDPHRLGYLFHSRFRVGATGALNEDGALGLRIAYMTSTAARVAKGFDVIRLVGDFQVAAVYGNQAQAGLEGIRMASCIGER